jgi:two-component system, NtrC family, response regulator AlgB
VNTNNASLPTLNILVVDDEPNIRKTLTICLEGCGHSVAAVSNPRDALTISASRAFDLAFVDLRLGTELGLDLIPKLLVQSRWLKIVVITAYASVDTAVEAMKRGAADYLPKPFTPAQVELVADKLARVRALENKVVALEQVLAQVYPEVDLSSASPAMQRAVALARQVATANATVLIRGESGTGKGVLARAIHLWSNRSHKPFTAIACPALSAELLESELFGHIRGAFTGAVRDNLGRIAASEGGTIFLDEIGDLPLAIQPKLLRFLQDRQYERVGESITRTADVRVVAATNCDLEAALKAGKLREDLFYRLNVIQIDVPPLRERAEDIVPLSARLLAFFSSQNNRHTLEFVPEALEALKRFRWPGNVRELRNAIERAVVLSQGEQVRMEHLPPVFHAQREDLRLGDSVSLDRIEEEHIRRVLAVTRSLDEAAQTLGIDQATLWRRRKQYGL